MKSRRVDILISGRPDWHAVAMESPVCRVAVGRFELESFQ